MIRVFLYKDPNYKIGEKLTELQSKGLTVIIGEFASTHPEGCNWIDIDAWEILRYTYNLCSL
jgi:hypothetical protein